MVLRAAQGSASNDYVRHGTTTLYTALNILDGTVIRLDQFFFQRVVGWAVSNRWRQELAREALRKALAIRRLSAGLIHPSDRGSHIVQSLIRPS